VEEASSTGGGLRRFISWLRYSSKALRQSSSPNTTRACARGARVNSCVCANPLDKLEEVGVKGEERVKVGG